MNLLDCCGDGWSIHLSRKIYITAGIIGLYNELKSPREVYNVKRDFTVVIERDEDGIYVASVPELVGCHTQAETLDELRERITEAVQLYLEGLDEIFGLTMVVFRGSLKVKPKSHKQMP